MESVFKAGRSIGNGVCRAAGALARGARRMLVFIPLLGFAPSPNSDIPESHTGGEEAENAASSPVEEQSTVSSPTAENEAASTVATSPATASEAKEEVVAASVASSPIEEKKEEPTPSAPTPVPVEDKKEEVEKVEAEKKVVESTPEPEVPVENNVAHVTITTESVEEAPKVIAPTVPIEAPASPPTAPAITEDVASVTKAIEEIEISDKAVAAAVNEAIECNTNEIIADAHHQNNINE